MHQAGKHKDVLVAAGRMIELQFTMLLDGTVEERGDAREDVVGPVLGHGPGQGRRRQPVLLLEVAPEEAVPGALQALRPEGPLHAPGGQPAGAGPPGIQRYSLNTNYF